MSLPAIQQGEPSAVLRLGPAGFGHAVQWSVEDSNCVSHFLQVVDLIQCSSWAKEPIGFTNSLELRRGCFPNHEQFVYVMIYFRQLMSAKDRVLSDACRLYCEAVDSRVKATWVGDEKLAIDNIWNGPSFPNIGITVGKLFDAVIYGASLVHSKAAAYPGNVEAFNRLVTSNRLEEILFALHGSLYEVRKALNRIGAVIHQDYSEWVTQSLIPEPNLMPHKSFFLDRTMNGKPDLA